MDFDLRAFIQNLAASSAPPPEDDILRYFGFDSAIPATTEAPVPPSVPDAVPPIDHTLSIAGPAQPAAATAGAGPSSDDNVPFDPSTLDVLAALGLPPFDANTLDLKAHIDNALATLIAGTGDNDLWPCSDDGSLDNGPSASSNIQQAATFDYAAASHGVTPLLQSGTTNRDAALPVDVSATLGSLLPAADTSLTPPVYQFELPATTSVNPASPTLIPEMPEAPVDGSSSAFGYIDDILARFLNTPTSEHVNAPPSVYTNIAAAPASFPASLPAPAPTLAPAPTYPSATYMDAAALDYPSASNTYAGSSANPALYPFFTAAPALDPQLQPALDQYGGWPQFLLNGLDTLSTLDPGDQTYPYTYPPEQYSDMCAALEGQGTGNYPATYAHPGPSEYPPLPLPLPLPLSSPATHAGLLVPASSSPPETRLATPHSQPESPAAGEPKKRRRKEKDEGKKAPPCTLPEKAKGGKRKGKQFKLAAHILEHEFYPHLTEAEKERLRGRIGGKQNKELTIIRAEREGRHFSVPRGLRCSICERFDYNCLMLRIVDYGHHAEAHLGHCAGCAGNADACTFKSNPQVRFAAYSAYYQGQTFASHGSLGHGTRVHPYESINEFTREHAIDERGPMRIKRLQEGLM